MPANTQSPRVSYEEQDRSAFVTSVGSSVAFIMMPSNKGSVDEGVLFTERQSFINKSGEPSLAIPSMHGALAVLQQTAFWGVRVASLQKFATTQRFTDSILVALESGTEVAADVYSSAQLSCTRVLNTTQTEDVTATAVWSSSDDGVATVDANGVVTAVVGVSTSVTITADYDGQTETFDLNVST